MSGFALIGGMLLNLMPCVFPVLFIKALALVQSSTAERRAMRVQGLAYTLGILVSFWIVVAMLLGLRAGGQQAGLGLPVPVAGICRDDRDAAVLPGAVAGGDVRDRAERDQRGLVAGEQAWVGGELLYRRAGGGGGDAMRGAVSGCGDRICAGAAGGGGVCWCLLRWAWGWRCRICCWRFSRRGRELLPKPGAWMEVLKQATAVPIFGDGDLAGVGVCAACRGDGAARIADGLSAAGDCGMGAGTLAGAAAGYGDGGGDPGCWRWRCRCMRCGLFRRRRACLLAASWCSHDHTRRWQPFTPDVVAQYQAQGRPVFVDFTADWCLSCQVNERVVLERPEVLNKLAGWKDRAGPRGLDAA